MKNIIINAHNIHTGGGYVLLLDFLRYLAKTDTEVVVCIDCRANIDLFPKSDKINYRLIKNNTASRFFNEIFVRKISSSFDVFINFTNIPSVFRLNCLNILFLQNNLLVSKFIFKPLNFNLILKLFLIRFLLRLLIKKTNLIYVQSKTMLEDLVRLGIGDSKIRVRPFADNSSYKFVSRTSSKNKYCTFIYPASSAPHKNHINLFKAMKVVFEYGIQFKLYVTLDDLSFKRLCIDCDLDSLVNNLFIENIGDVSHEKIIQYYSFSDALVFPSFSESFGLPLYEAKVLDLPVIASELDFVRDIVCPVQTFDPNSYISISRAITRFLCIEEELQEVVTPNIFYDFLRDEFN